MSNPLTLDLDPDLAARLRAAAEVDGETIESFARRVLADAVDLESLGDDAELARRIENWRKTRASAPSTEVHDWLRSLSAESSLARPKVRTPE